VSLTLASQRGVGVAICVSAPAFSAYQYDVPIASSPTRHVQEQLLGDWTSADSKEKLKLRRFDDSTYVVYYDGDLFRAYHCDIGEMAFVSVQDLNSRDRKYAYIIWKLSDDGKSLSCEISTTKWSPKMPGTPPR
jgi:hypothetical protein